MADPRGAERLRVRPLTRCELDELVDMAAAEGWNPGLHDAEDFWNTDPAGFLAAELDGQFLGGGSIVSYGSFGFMGFFIVKPEHRRRGFGTRLWFARRDALLGRLSEPKTIGMDGVFDMQAWYAKGGFVYSHRDLRYRALGRETPPHPCIVPLAELPLEEVLGFDRRHFPAPRPLFLKAWIAGPDRRALGYAEGGRLRGYGVVRACRTGCKIGPLFAESKMIASAIYDALAGYAPGQPVFLDVPENNPAAVALAEERVMEIVFGCARMYLGPAPSLPHDRIFGVTTFELG